MIGRTLGVVAAAETAVLPDWTPSKSGRLRAVKICAGHSAATSLIEHGHVKLSSSLFGGVDQIIPFCGVGLATAPAHKLGMQTTEVDVPVSTGNPVKVFYYYDVVPTTPILSIYAVIEG